MNMFKELNSSAYDGTPVKSPENISVCFLDAGGYASADPTDRKDATIKDLKYPGLKSLYFQV